MWIAGRWRGCSKESVDPIADQSQLIKSKNIANKSDGNIEAELEPFIISIIEDNENIVERNPEDVLLYTEATLNYRLVNEKELPSESAVVEIVADLNVEEGQNGSLIVVPHDILSFNDQLYTEIAGIATTYSFQNTSLSKIVSVVDLEWGLLSVGNNPVTVHVVISNYVSNTPSCQFNDSWYPAANDGGCGGNPATTSDAAQEINRRVNHKNCNQFLLHSYPYNPPYIALWYSIQKKGPHQYPYSKYSITSIFFGYKTECLSSVRLNELADSCIWIGNEEKPPSSDIYLRNIVVDFNPVTSSQPVSYAHTYSYFYGKQMTSALMAIDPSFL
mgnify:CR=1 FL=1